MHDTGRASGHSAEQVLGGDSEFGAAMRKEIAIGGGSISAAANHRTATSQACTRAAYTGVEASGVTNEVGDAETARLPQAKDAIECGIEGGRDLDSAAGHSDSESNPVASTIRGIGAGLGMVLRAGVGALAATVGAVPTDESKADGLEGSGEKGHVRAGSTLDSDSGHVLPYFGEHAHAWTCDDIPRMRSLARVNRALHLKSDWPPLYDLDGLSRCSTPVVAVVFEQDCYVPLELSLETAASIPRSHVIRDRVNGHFGLFRDASVLEGALTALGRMQARTKHGRAPSVEGVPSGESIEKVAHVDELHQES